MKNFKKFNNLFSKTEILKRFTDNSTRKKGRFLDKENLN
jgi:hypothetical protein